ncbi:protein cornichon homolog 4 [Plasmopara halstedii]|uniref:Protein cornichon homolog 4 n=1 Tax=Plasmopara halstedii TaxID=4781 RepID=A0A0P1AMC3_PLAHL|nr:protein cornichon homolog 4 [Plasmopara halstedii]CEG42309.1 protein cornichon homolog 4 [Plasmopara halstedii]|eukprot:XP_024578678.1 protein cornichon homolog 4 [Plasmopara halstedii]
MQVLVAVLSFIDIVALTFLNGYWLITLDELELDHLNPADVAKRLNKLVYPEMILHGILMLLCLLAWAPWVFLFNLPMAVWHARRYMRNEHMMDPTEILRFKNLQQARLESIARTVFYGLQIIYGMFWMVSAIVDSAKRRKGGKSV